MKPLHTGIALSLTLIFFYSLCTLVAVTWPAPFMAFVQALFHGLDFSMLRTPQPYTLSAFFYSLAVFGIWGFAVGAFFAWLHNTLARFHFPVG